jgi:hypothetical protein
MPFKRASQLSNEITERLNKFNENILKLYPYEKYVECLNNRPVFSSYNYIGSDVKQIASNILRDYDVKILELYHKLILTRLISNADGKLELQGLPDRINQLYHLNFDRILQKIESKAEWYYQIDQDKFLKDIALCRLQLIPTGVRKVELNKLPIKRFLFKKGLGQFISSVVFILFELKGFKPTYRGHLDSHDPNSMAEFNLKGWTRHYKLLAELLKVQKKVKAVVGNGWFVDPKLAQISPELSYIREIGVKNGAQLFYMGSNKRAVKRATFLSPIRKKLYKEGKYIPTNYLLVWGRNKIISWAKNVKIRN